MHCWHWFSLSRPRPSPPITAHLAAQLIPLYTSVDPIPGGSTLDEFRVVQPVVMLHVSALNDHLRFSGTLNLKGRPFPMGNWHLETGAKASTIVGTRTHTRMS